MYQYILFDLSFYHPVVIIFIIFLLCARVFTNRTLGPYGYPIQWAGLLITALFGLEAGVVISIPLCLLASYGLSNTLDLAPYYMISSLIGLLVLGPVRRFWGFVRAGAAISLSGLVVLLTVNERIDTDLSLDNYRLLSMVPLVRTDNFQLAFEGGISLFVIDAEVRGETVGTASESVTIPVPSVGILLQAKVGPVIFEADVSGFYFNWFGVDAVFVDAQFTVGYTFLKVCGVRCRIPRDLRGRLLRRFGIDAVLHGPFAGVSLQF